MLKTRKIGYSIRKKIRSNQTKVKKKKKKCSKSRKKMKTNGRVEEYKPSDLLTMNGSSPGQSHSSSTTQLSNPPDQKKVEKYSDTKAIVPFNNKKIILLHKNKYTWEQSQDDLFHFLHTQRIRLTLPNRSWSIHFTDKPIRSIVISEITLYCNSMSGYIPHYLKQVVLHERMAYEIFLFNSKIIDDLSPIESVPDLMKVISKINNVKLCYGGPEVSSSKNINLECAYKDNNKWRHNLCTMRVSKGDTCASCLTLEDKLKKCIERTKRLKTKTSSKSRKRKRKS
ncbi:PREDICTED: uncharacterized protein LOC106788764 [Polistes canadensis]|uniref:uncharacterized protein LOC106788764 n=1 Tax=Polistes canadensis TaxID=91411 RepID=UPI000718F9A3|nr:PREDICTED: uncharacterized protein LOC106788764 [Polistes canadensis]